MGVAVQLLENFYTEKIQAPDKIYMKTFNMKDVEKDFVLSRTKDGKVLSIYQDDSWNLSPYISNPTQYGIISFEKINKIHINNVKSIMLLLMIFGSGRKGSQYSVSTIKAYYQSLLIPIATFAYKKNITIIQCLENKHYLSEYIHECCSNRTMLLSLSALLNLLDNNSNDITRINYNRNEKIIAMIKKKNDSFVQKMHQTELIPSRILNEAIQQRWYHIKEIENNLNGLIIFFDHFFKQNILNKQLSWLEVMEINGLQKLFTKYNIKNMMNFISFISKIQGTCKHLIHTYTGMRNGEVLSLKTTCLEKITTSSGICRLISSTSKLEGKNKVAKWVTSKEIERIVFILNSLNNVIASHYQVNFNELPLFIAGNALTKKNNKENTSIGTKKHFTLEHELPLDYSTLSLTVEDIQEIEEIDFNKNHNKLQIGTNWNFKTHQYRRSLAVYSIQSGIVSLGALQIQLKHLFREMTLYYSNGSSYARKLFNIPKEHIANEFDKLKPELDTLTYIKNVIFSDEKLFGAHGNIVEKNKRSNQELKTYFLENRDQTLKQFKNGEIAYKETALGGCISTEACDSRLTRSITACFDCHGGILKKSKVDNVIKKQREFISFLDPSSIEYRTEIEDLNKLEELKNKLIKE